MTEEIIEEKDIEEIEDPEFQPVDEEEIKGVVKSIELDKEKIDEPEENKSPDSVKELYTMFASFLEKNAEIKQPREKIDSSFIIPTGIDLLDAVLGGGFVIGKFSTIVGTPGAGKSMLASRVLASAQKKFKGNIISAYLDSEQAMNSARLSNLGVNNPKIEPYSDLTIEKIFRFIEGMCVFKEKKKMIDLPSLVIWDSIAGTLSEKEIETEDPNSVIGYKARLLSHLIPKYAVKKSGAYNICLIAINQLRDQLTLGNIYQQPKRDLKFLSTGKTIPGGNAPKFFSYHLLEMGVNSMLNSEKHGFDGVLVDVKCVKNKLFAPNIVVSIVGNFHTGFSNFWTTYIFMTKHDRIKTGAWNNLVNLPDKKFRTKDAFKMYRTDQSFKDAYDELSKDAIQIEIINKYTVDIFSENSEQ